MSLGFTPQPLLSGGARADGVDGRDGVAGVYTPAFVERFR